MDDTLLILGRQPELGLAELESLYGADNTSRVGKNVAIVTIMPCSIDFARLGGSTKMCKILTTLPTTNWQDIIKFLSNSAPSQSEKMPAGKMHLGISAIGFNVSPAKINAGGLTIKKAISKIGRTVRLVPNKTTELNAASVIHNKLLTENGWELVIVRDNNKTIIAQSISVQDIDRYTLRDRGRPKRDAKVGMLPPKLAQIIINLATGVDEMSSVTISGESKVCLTNAENDELRAKRSEKTILDPFCGTGVVLQEAMLMGYNSYGSDLDERMVEYSKSNVTEWLPTKFASVNQNAKLEIGDATDHKWTVLETGLAVASETYLGRPFTSQPSPELVAKTASECNLIIKKFLRNIHDQLPANTRLCLAVPAWITSKNSFKTLPLIDQIDDLGYNRVSFKQVRDDQMIYYREDQIVARQLLVITRK